MSLSLCPFRWLAMILRTSQAWNHNRNNLFRVVRIRNPGVAASIQRFFVDDEIPVLGGSHASSSLEASLEPTTKRREDLGKHTVYTRFPKDRNCEICKWTKIARAPCRIRNGGAVPRAVNFGDLITEDHKDLSDNCESRTNQRYAIVEQDLATQWIQAYPCKNKTSQDIQLSFKVPGTQEESWSHLHWQFLGIRQSLWSSSWNHCTSTPNRSSTIGIAERALRRVKEGTSAVLLQSGLNESWWADSMECSIYLRNVTDFLSDGKTPYERRFGQPFQGPMIPFGSLVEYHPITAKDQSRIHQLDKVLFGLFLGYALYAGGIWKGDELIADLGELETMDPSEIDSKRLNAKEVIFLKQGEFIFPIADGPIEILGGESKTSKHPFWYGCDRHSRRRVTDFLEEWEEISSTTSWLFLDAGEAINDFWPMSGSFIYRHHVEHRVKLYSPREESFPIPLKYIDVSRTTHTNLDVKQEKFIDDFWNIDWSRDLSDPWTGFTQFTLLDEKAPDGYTWSGGRLTRKHLTSRLDHSWPEIWKTMGKARHAEGKAKVV